MATIDLTLYAWVGEDEMGSGEVGLKQALVPAGLIPLVSIHRASIDTPSIRAQLRAQVNRYGKTIRLVAFVNGDIEARALTTLRPEGPIVRRATDAEQHASIVDAAREMVARGYAHECAEWPTTDGTCAVCGEPL